MLTILFSVLRRVWWLIPIAAALAFGAFERHEAAVDREHAVQLEQKIGAQKAIVTQLQDGITSQNVGIENILQQGIANEKAAQVQAQQRTIEAQKVRVVYHTRIEKIEAAQVPATCASAADWASGQAKSLIEGWK